MRRVEEFWIRYELEDGLTEWEGPYRSELMASKVALDFLTHVPEATAVTTYLKLADEKEGTVETVRLLTRRRDTVKGDKPGTPVAHMRQLKASDRRSSSP